MIKIEPTISALASSGHGRYAGIAAHARRAGKFKPDDGRAAFGLQTRSGEAIGFDTRQHGVFLR